MVKGVPATYNTYNNNNNNNCMLLKVLQLDLTIKSGNIFHPLETFLVCTYIPPKFKEQHQTTKLKQQI